MDALQIKSLRDLTRSLTTLNGVREAEIATPPREVIVEVVPEIKDWESIQAVERGPQGSGGMRVAQKVIDSLTIYGKEQVLRLPLAQQGEYVAYRLTGKDHAGAFAEALESAEQKSWVEFDALRAAAAGHRVRADRGEPDHTSHEAMPGTALRIHVHGHGFTKPELRAIGMGRHNAERQRVVLNAAHDAVHGRTPLVSPAPRATATPSTAPTALTEVRNRARQVVEELLGGPSGARTLDVRAQLGGAFGQFDGRTGTVKLSGQYYPNAERYLTGQATDQELALNQPANKGMLTTLLHENIHGIQYGTPNTGAPRDYSIEYARAAIEGLTQHAALFHLSDFIRKMGFDQREPSIIDAPPRSRPYNREVTFTSSLLDKIVAKSGKTRAAVISEANQQARTGRGLVAHYAGYFAHELGGRANAVRVLTEHFGRLRWSGGEAAAAFDLQLRTPPAQPMAAQTVTKP